MTAAFWVKGAESNSRGNRFHAKYQGITDAALNNMEAILWICMYCEQNQKTNKRLKNWA